MLPPSIAARQKPSSGSRLTRSDANGVTGGFWIPGPVSSVPDSAGQSTPAIIHGGVTLVNGPFGGPALHFDGTSGYVDCGLNGATVFNWSTAVPFPRTFVAWFRLPTGATGGPIFSKGNNTPNSGWSMSVSTSAITFGFVASSNNHVTITTTISTNTWHQIAVTWNGAPSGTVFAYLDGLFVGSGTSTSGSQNNADVFNLWIGQAQYTGGTGGATQQWFSGELDHWFYDHRFYSANEIADLYRRPFQGFSGTPFTLPPPPSGPVAALPAKSPQINTSVYYDEQLDDGWGLLQRIRRVAVSPQPPPTFPAFPLARSPAIRNAFNYEDDQLQDEWGIVQRLRSRRTTWLTTNSALNVSKFIQYDVLSTPASAVSVSKFIQYDVLSSPPSAVSVSKFLQYIILQTIPPIPQRRPTLQMNESNYRDHEEETSFILNHWLRSRMVPQSIVGGNNVQFFVVT